MILDASKIALPNGYEKAASDILPGAVLMTADHIHKFTRVLEKDMREGEDIICLCLSSGRKLCVSTDQKLALIRSTGRVSWTVASDLIPGDHIRGNCDGVEIVLNVDGIMFYPKHRVRLVKLVTDRNLSFLAEGVSCR